MDSFAIRNRALCFAFIVRKSIIDYEILSQNANILSTLSLYIMMNNHSKIMGPKTSFITIKNLIQLLWLFNER